MHLCLIRLNLKHIICVGPGPDEIRMRPFLIQRLWYSTDKSYAVCTMFNYTVGDMQNSLDVAAGRELRNEFPTQLAVNLRDSFRAISRKTWFA